jgi:hypothetical protein
MVPISDCSPVADRQVLADYLQLHPGYTSLMPKMFFFRKRGVFLKSPAVLLLLGLDRLSSP